MASTELSDCFRREVVVWNRPEPDGPDGLTVADAIESHLTQRKAKVKCELHRAMLGPMVSWLSPTCRTPRYYWRFLPSPSAARPVGTQPLTLLAAISLPSKIIRYYAHTVVPMGGGVRLAALWSLLASCQVPSAQGLQTVRVLPRGPKRDAKMTKTHPTWT